MVIKSVKQTEKGVFIGFHSNLNVTDLTFKVELDNKKFYFRPIEIEVIDYDTVSVVAKELSISDGIRKTKTDLKDLLNEKVYLLDEEEEKRIEEHLKSTLFTYKTSFIPPRQKH